MTPPDLPGYGGITARSLRAPPGVGQRCLTESSFCAVVPLESGIEKKPKARAFGACPWSPARAGSAGRPRCASPRSAGDRCPRRWLSGSAARPEPSCRPSAGFTLTLRLLPPTRGTAARCRVTGWFGSGSASNWYRRSTATLSLALGCATRMDSTRARRPPGLGNGRRLPGGGGVDRAGRGPRVYPRRGLGSRRGSRGGIRCRGSAGAGAGAGTRLAAGCQPAEHVSNRAAADERERESSSVMPCSNLPQLIRHGRGRSRPACLPIGSQPLAQSYTSMMYVRRDVAWQHFGLAVAAASVARRHEVDGRRCGTPRSPASALLRIRGCRRVMFTWSAVVLAA